MNTKGIVVTVVIVAIAVGVFIFFGGDYLNGNNIPQLTATTSPSQSTDQYVGEISTTTSGQYVYTSTRYGFQFTYPQGWRVGDNHLGYGTFQLFNYPATEPGASSKGFAKNENKIEAGIGTGNPEEIVSRIVVNDPAADYPIVDFTNTRLKVGGQDSIRIEVGLLGGQKYITYRIPLKTESDEFLSISIYGDPSNFPTLDQIVQSIKWTE